MNKGNKSVKRNGLAFWCQEGMFPHFIKGRWKYVVFTKCPQIYIQWTGVNNASLKTSLVVKTAFYRCRCKKKKISSARNSLTKILCYSVFSDVK